MSINRILLDGHLGKRPEIRKLPSGKEYATFSIAVNDSWKDKEGNWQNKAMWFNVVSFYPDSARKLEKGDRVLIEGKIKTWEKDDKRGFNIEAERVYNLMPKAKEEKKEPQQAELRVDEEEEDRIPF